MRRAGIAAMAAGAVAIAVAAAAAQAPGGVTPHEAAARTAGQVTVTVRPGAIRLPGAATLAPLSTAQCEQAGGIACYLPGQLRSAYHLPAVYAKGITGKGQTIAIVDSFGSPTIKADLATFDRQFGYPAPPKFTIIAPAGAIPAFNPANTDMVSWAGETTLDVEYAHALAPGASILLVETPVAETEGITGFPQIVKAEEYVINHGLAAVISQSFGATEETFTGHAQLKPLRAAYLDAHSHHVTVLAASGDAGATDYTSNESDYYTRRVTSWPDSDPLVTAVGGTRLEQSRNGYKSVAWNDTYNATFDRFWGSADPTPFASGGGKSVFFARPAYQNGVKSVTAGHRGVPDIAMSAACNGAVSVYSSYQPGQAGWSLTCGTSEATPEFAAIVALADQVAGHRLGLINPTLYKLLARHAPGLVDITSGNNTVSFYQGTATKPVKVPGYPAGKGYDLVTGAGTVNAASLVYELAGVKS
jgi:subtilase family serine protease